MKPIIQKFWMAMVMLCLSISASAYDFEVDGIYYNITSMSNLTVEVTYATIVDEPGSIFWHNTTPYSGAIIIPESVNYLNKAFTVTGIGDAAFGYPAFISNEVNFQYSHTVGTPTSLYSITLPESITYIGRCAFQGCNISNHYCPLKNGRG